MNKEENKDVGLKPDLRALIKILYNKHRKLLGILLFCLAGFLFINLAFNLITSSILAEHFYLRGEFSKTEFLLKNRYSIQDTLCKKDKCKYTKIKPALQDLINFYYSQKDYDNIISLYNKHTKKDEFDILPTRIKGDEKERMRFIIFCELAYFYMANKQYEESKNSLDKALELIKNNPDFKELEFLPSGILANYYIAVNELNKAIETANKTVFEYKNVKQNYIKYITLAKIYSEKQFFAQSEKYIQLAYNNLPDFLYLNPINALIEINNTYGNILEKQNKLYLAKARFESSVSISEEFGYNYSFNKICSLYFLSRITKKLDNEEFNIHYKELLFLTKPLTTFKHLNAEDRYKKLRTICENFEYSL